MSFILGNLATQRGNLSSENLLEEVLGGYIDQAFSNESHFVVGEKVCIPTTWEHSRKRLYGRKGLSKKGIYYLSKGEMKSARYCRRP